MSGPVRTVFLGTGGFAVPVLARLTSLAAVELAGVVTAPPRPRGRGQREQPSPIGAWAAGAGIPVLTPGRLRDPEAVEQVAGLAPSLLVLVDYGQIVPRALLDVPRYGALNLHPSLLPRHRGATPIPAAILAGDPDTGVSLMRMDAGLDTGPLIAQVRTPMAPGEAAPALETRLSAMAADLLEASLAGWIAGTLPAVPQSDEGATLTRPLRREDGRLDPTLTAAELERQVRAYQPWPGTYLDTPAGRLIVRSASVAAPAADDAADPAVTGPRGLIRLADGGLGFGAADGVLRLDQVQLAGGRPMGGKELLRGRPALVRRG
jgi:methionyl-tRNA formyltransferase